MQWIKKENDTLLVKKLIKKYDLHPMVASIFARREITQPSKLLYYFEKNSRYFHHPFLFIEMEDAVDRILEARDGNEKVRIFGDRDVDGITATVIIYNALKRLGIDVSWSVPEGDSNYGLTCDGVREFANDGGKLIITVDCGISNVEEVSLANTLGVDTIITDHHNPNEKTPDAVAILNPKMKDSGYPFKHIAGCAVASKLSLALDISQTPIYKRNYTLLNIIEVNDAYSISAIKMRNLVEVDRITETVVPGVFNLESSKLNDFLVGNYIIVFEKELQLTNLRRCFGQNSEISLYDLAPDIWKRYSKLDGKSLLRLKEFSTINKYSQDESGEIDLFYNLYITFLLDRYSQIEERILSDIEFVTIGTIADLMPLEDENRLFVKLGLEKINSKHLPNLKPSQILSKSFQQLLYEKNLMEKPVTGIDLAWQITPSINATGRLGVPQKAVTFFLEPDSPNLRDRAQEIVSINEERKKLVAKVWDKLLSKARKSHEALNSKFVIVSSKEVHRGITGLIASRMSEYFQAPAMIVSFLEDKAVGSVRSYNNINVKNLLLEFEDYFNDFGGHDYAAGFNLPIESWEDFLEEFSGFIKKSNFSTQTEEQILIDAELTHEYFTPDIGEIAKVFEPYGEGNPPLSFLVQKVTIETLELIGKKSSDHVRMTIAAGKHKWVALFWNAATRAGIDFSKGDVVDIVFRLNRNYYKSRESLQLMIQDIKRSL